MEKECVMELPVPPNCMSIVLFNSKESMLECCKAWGFIPALHDGKFPDSDSMFPDTFVAFRCREKGD